MLGIKEALVRRRGPSGYVAVFSAVSILLLWWVVVAAGRAPHVDLWDTGEWQRWLANLAMPLAIALAVYGTGAPNPFAFEGREAGGREAAAARDGRGPLGKTCGLDRARAPAALAAGRWRPRAGPPLGRTLVAVADWAAAWHLHAPVIGVWPGP